MESQAARIFYKICRKETLCYLHPVILTDTKCGIGFHKPHGLSISMQLSDPQQLVDALWEKAQADPDFVHDNLEAIESITGLIDLGDVEQAVPKIKELLYGGIKDV